MGDEIERCNVRWHMWADHKCFKLAKFSHVVHECACGNKHTEPEE